jgi:hypothetical protein
LPILVALSAFLCAFADGFGRCCPAAAEDHFLITQNKDGPNRLLMGGMLGGDIKQLHGSVRLITTEFMHQGLTSCAGPKS